MVVISRVTANAKIASKNVTARANSSSSCSNRWATGRLWQAPEGGARCGAGPATIRSSGVAATLARRAVLVVATRTRPTRTVRSTRGARPAAVVLAGIELDPQRLTADLGRGDPAEGGRGELTGDLDGGEGVVDVDPAEILAVQAAFGGDRADDAAGPNAVGVTDGHPVALADRIATTPATLGRRPVAVETAAGPGIVPLRCERGGPDVLRRLAVVAGGQREQGGRELARGQVLLGQEGGDGLAVVGQRPTAEALDGLLPAPGSPCARPRRRRSAG